MDEIKKFRIALLYSDLDYETFGKIHGVGKQNVYATVRAMKIGIPQSARIREAIKNFTREQLILLRYAIDKAA